MSEGFGDGEARSRDEGDTSRHTDSARDPGPGLAGEGEPLVSRALVLSPAQLELLAVLRERDPRLANLYLGSLAALGDSSNPVRHAQSAHTLREILDAVLEAVGGQGPRMSDKLQRPESEWGRCCSGRESVDIRQWELDSRVRRFLKAIQEFFVWKTADRSTRREAMRRAIRSLDASGRPLPAPVEEVAVEAGLAIRNYFVRLCHFEIELDEGEFDDSLAAFETFLLDRLRPATFEDQRAIDEILGEAGDAPDA